MSDVKHTELPWAKKSFVDNRKHGGEHHTYLVTPQRGVYGTLFEADADFIVEACNSYYGNKREIERLTAENNELRTGEYLVKVIEERERLRKALEPFAAAFQRIQYEDHLSGSVIEKEHLQEAYDAIHWRTS